MVDMPVEIISGREVLCIFSSSAWSVTKTGDPGPTLLFAMRMILLPIAVIDESDKNWPRHVATTDARESDDGQPLMTRSVMQIADLHRLLMFGSDVECCDSHRGLADVSLSSAGRKTSTSGI